MIGTKWINGTNQPRIAEQAWDQVVGAVGSAGGSARSAKQRTASLADAAGSRVGSVADEARARANAAMDALAGRRPGLPWTWVVGAGLVGVAIGWAAGMVGQAAISRAVEEDGNPQLTDEIEIVDVDRPPANWNGGR